MVKWHPNEKHIYQTSNRFPLGKASTTAAELNYATRAVQMGLA